MTKCDYGCGQDATYYKFPTQKLPDGRYSCDVSPNKCPAKRMKTSGELNPGKRSEVKEKISQTNSVLFASNSELRKQCQNTLRKNYEVDNPMHNPENVKKVVDQRKEKNNYWFNRKLAWTPAARKKRKKTRIDLGLDLDPSLLNDFTRYEKIVDRLTEESYKKFQSYINPKRLMRGRIKGSYQLDHIMSKKDGFMKGILPQYIAHPMNLRMLTIEENISKHIRSDITESELFERISNFNQ